MLNKLILMGLTVLIASTSHCKSEILAPVDKYVTGSGAVWLVVNSDAEPKVALDGASVKGSFTEDGKVRHLRIQKIKPEGSKLTVDGASLSVSWRNGAPSSGEPRFHLLGAKNCTKCHEFNPNNCQDCHGGYGVGKHKGAKFASKCAECHAEGVPSTEAMAKICSGCHDKHSLTKHPKLRHPITSENDPKRPGRKMDCASCHDPHQPSCAKNMESAQKQEFCKECHTTP